MESLVTRINKLNDQGYKENFVIKGGQLYTDNDTRVDKNFVEVDAQYRIEDDSDPANEMIIYALSSKNPPIKGVLINSYGIYSEDDKNDFIDSITAS